MWIRGFEERYGGGKVEIFCPLFDCLSSFGSGNISMIEEGSRSEGGGWLSMETSSTIGYDSLSGLECGVGICLSRSSGLRGGDGWMILSCCESWGCDRRAVRLRRRLPWESCELRGDNGATEETSTKSISDETKPLRVVVKERKGQSIFSRCCYHRTHCIIFQNDSISTSTLSNTYFSAMNSSFWYF